MSRQDTKVDTFLKSLIAIILITLLVYLLRNNITLLCIFIAILLFILLSIIFYTKISNIPDRNRQ